MSEADKKDKILAYFNKEENRIAFFQTYHIIKLIFTDGSVDFQEIRYLIDHILSDGFLTGNNSKCQYNFSMTPFLESGGYVGEEARKKAEAEYQEVIKQKTRQEGMLVNWQTKTFWFVLGMAIVGAIIAVISLFKK